jgi:GNAT superfamily N-acetyltransferase
MTAAEMPQVIAYAKAEGWNPGLEDHLAFFEADANGFFVGEVAGHPVAFISAVRYPGKYGFLGLYIVHPDYRGHGYGLAVWNHAIAYLQDDTIGLDGVVAQIDHYKKSGFELAFMQMRWGGKALSFPENPRVKSVQSSDFTRIIAYDRTVFGFDRTAFLTAWMGMHNARSFYTEENGIITGWALIRACAEGYKIGPLFADSVEVAHQLFQACHASVKDHGGVYIDMPETQFYQQAFVEQYGLACQFKTARMYKNGTIPWDQARIYGITTFELG